MKSKRNGIRHGSKFTVQGFTVGFRGAVFFALIMLMGASGKLCAEAKKVDDAANLFKPGDMETTYTTNGIAIPTGWSVLGAGQATLSADTEIVESGKQSLKIEASHESPQTWVRSETIPVKPLASYELTASIQTSLPWCGFEVYESDGGWNPGDGQYLFLNTGQGKWEQKKAVFKTRAGTKWLYIGILIGEKNGGSVWIDNVALREVD